MGYSKWEVFLAGACLGSLLHQIISGFMRAYKHFDFHDEALRRKLPIIYHFDRHEPK